MKRFLVASAVLLAACGVSQEQHEAALAEARQSAAERDSLVAEVLVTAALINQIQAELAEVEDSTITMAVPTEGDLDRPRAQDQERAPANKHEQHDGVEQLAQGLDQCTETTLLDVKSPVLLDGMTKPGRFAVVTVGQSHEDEVAQRVDSVVAFAVWD